MLKSDNISVIIPCRNGAATMPALLEQLSRQSLKIDELLVVDSSSSDNSVAIARKFNAQVTVIPETEFDHGATRSMMAEKATGDILVFFTQDAVPLSGDIIEKLTAPLRTDDSIVISYGRQLANHDATIFARTLREFNYPPQSTVRSFSDRTRLGLKTVFVSNSCASYRKSALQEVGYFPDSLIFGEDTIVAGKLLAKGRKIAYVADACVYHSHNYSIHEEFKRSFDIGVLHKAERWLLEMYGRAEGEGMRYIQFELSRILKEKGYRLLPLFFCRNFAKFIGYKMGSMYHVLPQWLLPVLSMHAGWWTSR